MTSLLSSQGAYDGKLTAGERLVTSDKLVKSRFLRRDPPGDSIDPMGRGRTDERRTRHMVWDYLRVHLTRILDKVVLIRVQGQEWMYRNRPDLREGIHNKHMTWLEYKKIVTCMLPKYTDMYVLTKVLTLSRDRGLGDGRHVESEAE